MHSRKKRAKPGKGRSDSWYSKLEARVRPIVRLLRDNGFNTSCSCGHEMFVECHYEGEDLWLVRQFLLDHGFRNFRVTFRMGWNERTEYSCLTIWFPRKDGTISPFSEFKGSMRSCRT